MACSVLQLHSVLCIQLQKPSTLRESVASRGFGLRCSAEFGRNWPDSGKRSKYRTGLQLTKRRVARSIVALRSSDEGSENGVLQVAKDKEVSDLAPKSSSGGSSFLTILCPLLKFLGGGDPSAPRNTFLETATTGVASMARLPWGSQVIPEAAAARTASGQPPKRLQLYEFEACPFCRRVREALTELDLTVEVFPCPKGSLRHREFVRATGGKDQFPFFLDPNTGVSLYESSDIVQYLFNEYGAGGQPTPGLLESTLVTGWVPTLVRAGRGMQLFHRASAQPPAKMLELYSYENNQFARLVREALCELELPYILRNAGKGSSERPALLQLAGSTQVPYLVDPNTGISMPESKDIIAYLFKTYGSDSSELVSA
ncbi:uncharacterized protein [Physcomitrium patens]|uniref:GST N-terminal domain-containing protein n=1 Tax=Physcomitrium patens TaxID=3218 RepID=A0A2K1K7H1_PHYPA|nr:uncharacterized protein LOC112285284 [Physcomitrium patens]XP_024381731.1 uncharacterized protein LOC112285284 [Physcomitrium patens]XP_024381732.1 uncharacterized protein LOC112285284 [Physcomitrium patens]PNR49723.1 hypothetical protein PHYPA_011619 [Physcomitrium patens]|eukprot:XP_024381730.1 uncharacterized protein LOC112285284 [Physcomitrella patens]